MITKLFGFAALIGCLACVYLFEGASFAEGAWRIFHWPAIVLTGLGPTSLICISSDWALIFTAIRYTFGENPRSKQRKYEREALFLQKLGKTFYAEGPKTFENVKARGLSPTTLKVIERLAVRMPLADIRELLETERDRRQARLHQCINVVGLGVRLAPSVGMLGTILGMVELLSTLQDPSQIGSRMSLALFTTFYGLFFSLAIWTPIQQKLERTCDVELEGYNQVLRWLEFIERRKPADYFADTADIHIAKTGGEDRQEPSKARA